MNRQQRRALKSNEKEPTYNISGSMLESLKIAAVEEGCAKALFLMLAIPTMVVHDKFSSFMKKKCREENFVDECLKLYELYNEGYVGLEDLWQCLEQEAQIKMPVVPKINFAKRVSELHEQIKNKDMLIKQLQKEIEAKDCIIRKQTIMLSDMQ